VHLHADDTNETVAVIAHRLIIGHVVSVSPFPVPVSADMAAGVGRRRGTKDSARRYG